MNYKQSDVTAWRIVDGKAYVINTKDSVLHEMDEVGTFIWGLLKKPVDIKTITHLVHDHYEVKLEEAEKDVEEYIKKLNEKKLLEIIW